VARRFGASMAQAMTPHEALDALSDLPRYEERLEARTAGLTFMLWGFAIAGIFVTYTAAADWLEDNDAAWALAALWVPWVAAGSAFTAMLWTSHAITLRRDPAKEHGMRISLVITLLFLVLAAGVFGILDVLLGVEWTINSLMAVASGLCAALLGVWQRKQWGPGARNLIVAGLGMLAAGLTIGLTGVGPTAAGLLAASAVGTAWMVAGACTYRSG